MARPVLPHTRLLKLDQQLHAAAARPVIVPETIVCDHGKAFISQNFRSSCRMLGITVQPITQPMLGPIARVTQENEVPQSGSTSFMYL